MWSNGVLIVSAGTTISNPHRTIPTGPPAGSTRVLRGGNWFTDPSFCRSASRNYITPAHRFPQHRVSGGGRALRLFPAGQSSSIRPLFSYGPGLAKCTVGVPQKAPARKPPQRAGYRNNFPGFWK